MSSSRYKHTFTKHTIRMYIFRHSSTMYSDTYESSLIPVNYLLLLIHSCDSVTEKKTDFLSFFSTLSDYEFPLWEKNRMPFILLLYSLTGKVPETVIIIIIFVITMGIMLSI